jgi:hypothetical protein
MYEIVAQNWNKNGTGAYKVITTAFHREAIHKFFNCSAALKMGGYLQNVTCVLVVFCQA